MKTIVSRLAAPLATLIALGGCAMDGPEAEHVGEAAEAVVSVAPFTKYCSINVQGKGPTAMESDYLPHVMQCENPDATGAALRAQAIAARSYAYYKIHTSGAILDGQGDQVYSVGGACKNELQPAKVAAAADTEGTVLRYQGVQIAAFFVAGATNQQPPSCKGSTTDPTHTEHRVTYNEGKTGDNVTKSSLGGSSSPANRGCMSQNGSRCLSDSGKTEEEILRFYYGADIELVTIPGDCSGGGVVAECSVSATAATAIEDSRECFQLGGAQWWDYKSADEHAYFTYATNDANAGSYGKYYLRFESAGTYQVEVCLPDVGAVSMSKLAKYKVWANGAAQYATIDQAAARGGCASLGDFQFAAGSGQAVRLDDNTGEPYKSGGGSPKLYLGTLRVTPAGTQVTACGTPPCDVGSAGAEEASSGGCSIPGEPVERRFGVVAIMVALAGFWSRRRRQAARAARRGEHGPA